jgi:hypothetical protein
MLFDTGCILQVEFCSKKLHNNFKIVTSLQIAFSCKVQHHSLQLFSHWCMSTSDILLYCDHQYHYT